MVAYGVGILPIHTHNYAHLASILLRDIICANALTTNACATTAVNNIERHNCVNNTYDYYYTRIKLIYII